MINNQYTVVCGVKHEVEVEVTKKLNDGWTLVGGPFVTGKFLNQGMVKETFIKKVVVTDDDGEPQFVINTEPITDRPRDWEGDNIG